MWELIRNWILIANVILWLGIGLCMFVVWAKRKFTNWRLNKSASKLKDNNEVE